MIGLTPDELAVLRKLKDTTTLFVALPPCHPAERAEYLQAVHRIQDLVMMRAAVRAHPDQFVAAPGFE